MNKFGKTCLFGTIPSFSESHSFAISGRKGCPLTVGLKYIKGSLLHLEDTRKYPEILWQHVLDPHMKIGFKKNFFLFGTSIAKHGYFQRNIADISSCIYALETILPLIHISSSDSSSLLVITSTARGLMNRIFSSLYGIQSYQEVSRDIVALQQDASRLDSNLRSKISRSSSPLNDLELWPIKNSPKIHERMVLEYEALEELLSLMVKKKHPMTYIQRMLSVQKLWTCFLVLFRVSESLFKSSRNAHYELLLATRYCQQVKRDIFEDKSTAEGIRKYEELDAEQFSKDSLSFDMKTFCPLQSQ